MPILDKEVRRKLVETDCLKLGLKTEYDVVGMEKIPKQGKRYFIVVECKYHSRPISDKEIKCFAIKSDYLNEYVMDKYRVSIKERWFVSLSGFTPKAKDIATSLSIKQIDRRQLNQLLIKHNLPQLLNI